MSQPVNESLGLSHSRHEPVRVGLIGAGFAARIHLRAYHACARPPAQVVAIASRRQDRAQAVADEHQIRAAYDDYRRVLDRPEVDVVDLCVPNNLHLPLAIEALQAAKHVIVEKPLTGYFGGPDARGNMEDDGTRSVKSPRVAGAAQPVGSTPREVMLGEALRSADSMLAEAERRQLLLMYAENWAYAPAVQRARQLLAESNGTILEIRGAECHSGSHAAYAKRWAEAGGGALLRLGAHPIGAAIFLKWQEGLRRSGRPIPVVSVLAEAANLAASPAMQANPQSYLVQDWEDVENWAVAVLTFADGARAVCLASDVALGGMEDWLQVLTTHARINIDLTHSTMLRAYAPDASVFPGEPLQEKLHSNAGWTQPPVDFEFLLGYQTEIQDFVAAVAERRSPLSDGTLGRAVVEVIYAAYLAAARRQAVDIGGESPHPLAEG